MNQDPLSTLRDVHLPPEISWWPLAPGWWGLLAMFISIFGFFVWYWLVTRRKRLLIKQVKTKLENIEYSFLGSGNSIEAFRALSVLLRRVVLTLCKDFRVGALKGSRWIDFLNHLTGSKLNSLEMLVTTPFVKKTNEDPLQLIDEIRNWLNTLPKLDKTIETRMKKWFDTHSTKMINSDKA